MPSALYDAHIHLADSNLLSRETAVLNCYANLGIRKVICNGTSPQDWDRVLQLAKRDRRVIPAVGLHPWAVDEAPEDWKSRLLQALQAGAQAIGEVGLDRWRTKNNFAAQHNAFDFQLKLATQFNRPISIHCLKATGPLMDILRSRPTPVRGIHLHAYSGPVELIPELVEIGTFFSFNAGQLVGSRPKVLERIRAVPDENILIETDAPNFLPEPIYRAFEFCDSDRCHPGNIQTAYQAIASVRGQSLPALTEQVESNFIRYFE